MCVCVHVCMYVCVSASMCMYVCASASMCVCKCVYMCMYVCVSASMCMYVCVSASICVCKCVYMCDCVCMCVSVCVCVLCASVGCVDCVCEDTHACKCVCTRHRPEQFAKEKWMYQISQILNENAQTHLEKKSYSNSLYTVVDYYYFCPLTVSVPLVFFRVLLSGFIVIVDALSDVLQRFFEFEFQLFAIVCFLGDQRLAYILFIHSDTHIHHTQRTHTHTEQKHLFGILFGIFFLPGRATQHSVFLHIFTHTHTHTHTHKHTHTRKHTHTHTHTHAHTHTPEYNVMHYPHCKCAHFLSRIDHTPPTHAYPSVQTRTHTHTRTYTRTYTRTHTQTHTHKHTHIHTRTHPHTYTQHSHNHAVHTTHT